MTRKRKKLLVSLIKRLKASDVPKQAMYPSFLDQILTGGLMVVSWKRRTPCGCPMCNDYHERVIVFAAPTTEKPLEQIFSE